MKASAPCSSTASLSCARMAACSGPSFGRRLGFQFPLQLIQEPPISTLCDKLLGPCLDQSTLVEPDAEKPQGILRVVGSPPVVGERADHLERHFVLRLVSSFHDVPRRAFRLPCAYVGGLEEGAKRPLGRDRVCRDEFLARRDHAAEVLVPRAIKRCIDDDPADLLCPKHLRLRRKRQNGISLPVDERI